jgi:cytidine deaminase
MTEQSRLNDQNRIRSAGKVRRLTLEELGIPLLNEDLDVTDRLLDEAEAAAVHTRGDGPARGAAVLTTEGEFYAAARIAPSNLQQTNHALELAVMKALTDGASGIVEATVYAGEPSVEVCGACRQLLAEYGMADLVVHGVVGEEEKFAVPIEDLLPDTP